jgi:hypothetical protein
MKKVIVMVLRHAVTLIGGAGIAVSDNDLETIASGVVAMIGVGMELWAYRQAQRAIAPPPPPPIEQQLLDLQAKAERKKVGKSVS